MRVRGRAHEAARRCAQQSKALQSRLASLVWSALFLGQRCCRRLLRSLLWSRQDEPREEGRKGGRKRASGIEGYCTTSRAHVTCSRAGRVRGADHPRSRGLLFPTLCLSLSLALSLSSSIPADTNPPSPSATIFLHLSKLNIRSLTDARCSSCRSLGQWRRRRIVCFLAAGRLGLRDR